MRPSLLVLVALTLACPAAAPAQVRANPAPARHAMVVTEEHYATQAGLNVLRAGGNAVDAAVAVAYALAVVDPCCGNIGGGGFMLVRMHGGRQHFIDFRETAPLRANPQMFLDKNGNVIPGAGTVGYLASGVPGTVMGMERARTEFGTFSRSRLLQPAIALAARGFTFSPGDTIPFAGADFANQPNVRAIFMKNGHTPRAGDRLVQPQLAQTLRAIAAGGTRAFYEGPIARAVVSASYRHGGMLAMDDFKAYTVRESAPVHCSYHGYGIISVPPPSSGGVTMCEILNILANLPMAGRARDSAAAIHDITEAERRAYADRNAYLGDPAFVANPVAQLLDTTYARALAAQIDLQKATPSVQVKPGLGPLAHEHEQTTHFSIVDRFGNAAAVTYTINDWFGAHVIAGDTGFFLNDEMDDFTSKPGVPNMYGLVQGERNDIRPGKRPLSSMSPTIVTKNGKLFMVTGSPGGSRIPTITLSTILNVVDYGMNAQQAVDAPRTHMQWLPDQLQYEPGAFSAQTADELRAMGYTLTPIAQWGSAQAIVADPLSGVLYGGTDRRRPSGSAAGY
ncbi:MAG: gamma-glutamyltransferase [Candidatus Baltobacteraceae bacterium]